MTPPLNQYLRMLAGPGHGRTGRYLDIRWPLPAKPGRMGQRFYAATDLTAAGRFIEALADSNNVYIGVALHDREEGDSSAVSRSHLLWADIDREDAQDAIDAFPYKPTMTLASGSPGRRHTYFLLDQVAAIDDVMVANRKLAGALGGDLMMGLSPVSMLRPAGTYSYKRQPRTPVRIIEVAGSRVYQLEQLVEGLVDPKPPKPPYVPSDAPLTGLRLQDPSIAEAHNALKQIDARIWMPRLTGLELVADDRILCPFHEERTASLKAYPNGSWYCWGCHQGGDIIKFASLLWNRSSDDDFIEVRAELARMFLGVELPTRRRLVSHAAASRGA